MKITLNPEYVQRHLFACAVLLGLGLWFGYDGFIRYPATPAAELYRSIEGSEAPETVNLEAFKRQKTQTQYGFTFLCLAAGAVVGLRLLKSARLKVTFDETGYTANGRPVAWSDVKTVDRRRWKDKGIVTVDGLTLDAWHHKGVHAFTELLPT